MFKLDLDKAEDLQIKLPTSVGTKKKQENSRKTSISASLTTQKLLTVWITTNYGKSREGKTRLPSKKGILSHLSAEKPVCRSRSNSENQS